MEFFENAFFPPPFLFGIGVLGGKKIFFWLKPMNPKSTDQLDGKLNIMFIVFAYL